MVMKRIGQKKASLHSIAITRDART